MKYKVLLISTTILLFVAGAINQLLAQVKMSSKRMPNGTSVALPSTPFPSDSAVVPQPVTATMLQNENSTTAVSTVATIQNPSGLDTVVVFKAADTMRFTKSMGRLRLRGTKSTAVYGQQSLTADVIEVYFTTSTMKAQVLRDSSGRLQSAATFADKGEEYYGEKLAFNFKTKKGSISTGETVAGEGFYFGDKITKMSDDIFFIENGCYTTCDHPNPHFYFKSPKMKVVANDKIFADPLMLYIQDIPVFILPIGIFIENKSGRRSGLLIPSFFFSNGVEGRGVFLQNLGYYWAVSDYFDTRLLTTLTSKGGYLFTNESQYSLRDQFNGGISLSYGRQRFGVENDPVESWGITLRHSQRLDPQTNITANLRFNSQDFNRQNETNIINRAQQNITSDASFSTTFDNGIAFSARYSRNQNIITGDVQETFPSIAVTVPQLFPFSGLASRGNWIGDIALNYSATAERSSSVIKNTVNNRTTENTRTAVRHNPSINISPRLGYFTLNPSISYNENWYFRRLTRTMNEGDSLPTDSYENGFFREYQYSFGFNMQTKLYGIVNPRIFGINSIRHTLIPTIGYSFAPDLSGENFGFFGRYYNTRQGDTITYSRFESDGGGGVSRTQRQALTYSLNNRFEAKIAQGDTLQDKVVQLLTVSLNGSYNFVADSLRMSPLSMNFRADVLEGLNLSGNAGFEFYDQQLVTSTTGFQQWRTINTSLLEAGKGLLRLTNIGFQFNTSFNSQGLTSMAGGNTPLNTTVGETERNFGERFRLRDQEYQEPDFYGDNTPGFRPINIPWEVSLFTRFNYNRPNPDNSLTTLNLGASFSFSLTDTWRFRSSFNYEVIRKEITVPTVEIDKDLHCWELNFRWYPVGFSRGFYLRLGLKTGQLRDLQIERRSDPVVGRF